MDGARIIGGVVASCRDPGECMVKTTTPPNDPRVVVAIMLTPGTRNMGSAMPWL